jgi:hypothetical protein
MAGEGSQSDFWDALEDAEMTVERWPPWQQQYDPDIFYDEDAPGDPRSAKSTELRPAIR